jgi:hypothetical protein
MNNNNKTLIAVVIIIIAISLALYFFFFYNNNNVVVINDPNTNKVTSVVPVEYKNTDYGFNFTLPATWQGYSIINETWKGSVLKSKIAQSGPKILIRNPRWTSAAPYEDLPILVFTTSQWNAYLADGFSVSAAPIPASEMARNNKYVFALPPRWDFDYSLDFKEAEDIIAGKPLQPFNLPVVQGKLNTDLVCEQSISYMKFVDAKSAATFVADCKAGKHPEVIEKYKLDMNLGDGAKI